jgi:hypothetical protein
VAARASHDFATNTAVGASPFLGNPNFPTASEPLSAAVRKAALEQVDKDLQAAGLLTGVGGTVSPQAQKDFEVTSESCLPTAGVIVKGCLDDCDICEPEVQKKIQLELEEQDLRNQLLKRQIELLEKSQEYRCCPEGAGPDA